MWRGSDPLVVLRLLVLLSYVGNGLPKKHAGGCSSTRHLLSQHWGLVSATVGHEWCAPVLCQQLL